MADNKTTKPEVVAAEELLEKEGKVAVDKVTLDNIMERLSGLEGAKTSRRVSAPLKNTARVRFLTDKDGKERMVVGYGKSWEKTDLGGRRYLVLQVLSVDEKGVEVKTEEEYVRFMEEGKQVQAEIVSKQVEEVVDELGMVNKTKVDYDNFRTEATDVEVPLQVKTMKITYKLRLPDGKEVELPEEALN